MISQLDRSTNESKSRHSQTLSECPPHRPRSSGKHTVYLPSRDEIRSECRRIQASWTHEERRQRQVTADSVPWSIPWLKVADLADVLQ